MKHFTEEGFGTMGGVQWSMKSLILFLKHTSHRNLSMKNVSHYLYIIQFFFCELMAVAEGREFKRNDLMDARLVHIDAHSELLSKWKIVLVSLFLFCIRQSDGKDGKSEKK